MLFRRHPRRETRREIRKTAGRRRLFSGLMAAGAVAMGAVLVAPTPAAAESFTGYYLAARHAAASQDVAAAAQFYGKALSRRPDAVAVLEPAMAYALAAGDVARGVRYARRIARAPAGDHSIARFALAADAAERGAMLEARELLNADGAEGVMAVLGDLLAAWTAEAEGDPDAALARLDAADVNTLFSLFKNYHRGLLLETRGDHAGAIAAFDEAIKTGGGATTRLTQALAASLINAGDRDRAAEVYRTALARNPQDATILGALAALEAGAPGEPLVATAAEGMAEAFHGLAAALAQDRNGRFGLIFAQLAQHLRPDLDEGKILIGEIYDEMGQFDLAEEAYGAVAEGSALYTLAQLRRSGALDDLGRDEEALASLTSLAERAPGSSQIQIAIAEFFSRHERFAECAEAYDDGAAMIDAPAERHWVVFYGRGICHERIGAWDQAELNFNRALELRPNQADVLNYLGYSLLEQHTRFEEAKEMIERAVAARPDSGYIVDSLGWALYRLGDYEGAVKQLERAVSLSPVEPVITDHLGDALWKVGRKFEAEFQWRRALSFDPEEKDRLRIERKLAVGLDTVLDEEASQPKKVEAPAGTSAEQGG